MRAKKNGTGCPACANQQVHIDGRNSLASVNPEVASEFHPEKNGEITPEEVVSGTEEEVEVTLEPLRRVVQGNGHEGKRADQTEEQVRDKRPHGAG